MNRSHDRSGDMPCCFSEDLDFSTTRSALDSKELEQAMASVCDAAAQLLDEYAPVEIGASVA